MFAGLGCLVPLVLFLVIVILGAVAFSGATTQNVPWDPPLQMP
jgi:hypothetical protein